MDSLGGDDGGSDGYAEEALDRKTKDKPNMVFKRLFVFANLKCIKRPLSQQEPSQTSFLSCQQIRKGRHHTQAGCNGDEDKD